MVSNVTEKIFYVECGDRPTFYDERGLVVELFANGSDDYTSSPLFTVGSVETIRHNGSRVWKTRVYHK